MKTKITVEDVEKALKDFEKNPEDKNAIQTIFDYGVQIGAIKYFSIRVGQP